jgi:actin cytoskeleton-regulatory complex protein SLA1
MGFLGVYKALYDYEPQSEGELAIKEGDTLYVLEKSTDDDWWKAKKKAAADDEDEPTGLIPNNYVEEVRSAGYPRVVHVWTWLTCAWSHIGSTRRPCSCIVRVHQTDGRGALVP